MSKEKYFIAGDWGTSRLRLYLCEHATVNSPILIDSASGPGVSKIESDFKQVLLASTGNWLEKYPSAPLLLSGMIGSTLGWHDVPYIKCPVELDRLSQATFDFSTDDIKVSIVSGLETINPLGVVDLMRGEELQLLGWHQQRKNTDDLSHLIVLPGTHNKWVSVKNGVVRNFITALSGELFALLNTDSVLIVDGHQDEFNLNAFHQGLDMAKKSGGTDLLHSLFATRSKQVLGELSPTEGPAYLSALIIGADVLRGVTLFNYAERFSTPIVLIGASELTRKYSIALDYFGLQNTVCDPDDIAMSGYDSVFQSLGKK